MKLKNNSARPHWIGDVCIAPGGEGVVGDEWRDAYNKADLSEVVESAEVESGDVEAKKRGRPAKVKIDADGV